MPTPSFVTPLSYAYVAFTIEVDAAFERRMPHRTTRASTSAARAPTGAGGPWLASLAMYLTCLRFVDDVGTAVANVERLARTRPNWHGMQRWGYVEIVDRVARATPKGALARSAWPDLIGDVEARWCERFGTRAIDELRSALLDLVRALDRPLPACVPILRHGLSVGPPPRGSHERATPDDERALVMTLGKVLTAFAFEFERGAALSLALGETVVRELAEPICVRDLPERTGVSREAIAMSLTYLVRRELANVESAAGKVSAKIAHLTTQGMEARAVHIARFEGLEQRWRERYGARMARLERAMQSIAGTADALSLLLRAIEPAPGDWRATLPPKRTLPRFPLVLHRGGFPDGS